MTKQLFNKKDNCLNTIRLIAALQVLYGHATYHLHISGIPLFGEILLFFEGVPIFFTMSGYLNYDSVCASESYGEYLKKRFWRIYPELWGAILVELLAIVILYNQSINWSQFGLFALAQGTFFQFWTPDFLRAYGCGSPNGALWTICTLIQFYIIAYPIFKILHNRKPWVWLATIAASIVISFSTQFIRENTPAIVSQLYGQTVLPNLWMFICAAFVSEYKNSLVPFLKRHWWMFIIVLILNKYIIQFDVSTPYSLLGTMLLFLGLIGFAYGFPKMNIKTDISYGIYIYHMTIVNVLIQLGFSHNQWLLIPVAFISILLAWMSTKTVGSWAGNMKEKLILK